MKEDHKNIQKGYVALVAVILIASGTLVFSLTALSSAVSFSENVYKRELRIQAGLNARSCLEIITLMLSRDYFLSGKVEIAELGCLSEIENDTNGGAHIISKTVLEGVNGYEERSVSMDDSFISF